jgi:hypothetical protein
VALFKFTVNLKAQRFALAAGGRDEIKLQEQDFVRAWKKPVNRAESHLSAARFVSPLFS